MRVTPRWFADHDENHASWYIHRFLRLEQRFATWDLRPFRSDSTFAVSIYRVPS